MTFADFCSLRFPRRFNIQDRYLLIELKARNVPAIRAGYCDWLDNTTSVTLNIGWEWYETSASRQLVPGGISSNVMLLTANGADFERTQRDTLLHFWLEQQHWRNKRRSEGLAAIH